MVTGTWNNSARDSHSDFEPLAPSASRSPGCRPWLSSRPPLSSGHSSQRVGKACLLGLPWGIPPAWGQVRTATCCPAPGCRQATGPWLVPLPRQGRTCASPLHLPGGSGQPFSEYIAAEFLSRFLEFLLQLLQTKETNGDDWAKGSPVSGQQDRCRHRRCSQAGTSQKRLCEGCHSCSS